MGLGFIDIAVFVGFMLLVVGVSLWAGRKEKSSEDYFLAGRSLSWGLIGFSLIASNISTEHFVGMAGSAFGRVGLAIASYEWMSAVCLVFVAWWLLPKFLKAGIYTMPEYLEYRYDRGARTIMATYLMALYVVALLATVLYSGAQGLNGIFGFPEQIAGLLYDGDWASLTEEQQGRARLFATMAGAWMIGIIAAVYTIYGGLKAVVWSDLLQGGALLMGGAIVLYLGLKLTGGGELGENGGVSGGSVIEGWKNFAESAKYIDDDGVQRTKLSVILPWNDPDVPWLAVFVGGLWIPNLFYWGLNQFITQRTLGAKSLAEGQKGIFLACVFKLLIPFIIVIPGIIAWQQFGPEIMAQAGGDEAKAGEQAYPYMIAQMMPTVLRGVMLAALAGAIMSTFNSGINSASTIFTVDLYSKYINTSATPQKQVVIGRWSTGVIAVLACLMAPLPGMFSGVFAYIQEIWGFISPGIVAVFLGGMVFKKAPALAGRMALIVGPIVYAVFRIPGWFLSEKGEAGELGGLLQPLYDFSTIAFLHHMFIIFVGLFVMMGVIAAVKPMAERRVLPVSNVNVEPWKLQYVAGGGIIAVTVMLYIAFR
jgi:SSS family solute:Na+ symporter